MDYNTEITKLFNIRYPILLAGMNVAAGPKLAAAVTNAGGLGVIGGMNYTPKMLKVAIKTLKENLVDKNGKFGVDLLLPKVGEGARKTNHDYTKGNLDKLIDIIIEEKVSLFVSAVGVPPKYIVDKLHKHNILVMNMIGSPKHVSKALSVGVDILCAQGSEGGGHTGDIGTMVLIPAVVDACKGKISNLTKKQVQVIAAGGIYDGRTFMSAICLGASAVWIGTRFVASLEAGATKIHKKTLLEINHDDTKRTLVYTGRPLRIAKNEYSSDWEKYRKNKMDKLLKEGTIPCNYDMNNIKKNSVPKEDIKYLIKYKSLMEQYPQLLGQVSGSISDIKTAKEIIDDIINESRNIIKKISKL
jgi:NAD(P)H-dependent flavin oxidoreductase YrpB (nitropropane dioxygenase family)